MPYSLAELLEGAPTVTLPRVALTIAEGLPLTTLRPFICLLAALRPVGTWTPIAILDSLNEVIDPDEPTLLKPEDLRRVAKALWRGPEADAALVKFFETEVKDEEALVALERATTKVAA